MTVVTKLISFVILCWVPISWAQEANFAVDKVAIDISGCQKVTAKEAQFACHRLGPGQGFVVAERRYWPPKQTDDDAFEKVTVYFPSKPTSGHVTDIPSDEVLVFFSSGPSSFPGKHGCYGAAKGGKVEVTDISEKRVAVTIDVSIDLKSPLGWQGECKQVRLRKDITAQTIAINELNAWDGLVAPSYDLWKESHP